MDALEAATGALVGLAVADALGAPLEFSEPAEARRAVERGLEMTGGGPWEPGEWTDDTAMALALAESIGERGLLDLDDVARRYAKWAASGPKDIGNITRTALQRVSSAEDARRNAKALHDRTGMTAGNGTVMRAAPIAFAATSMEAAVTGARADAALTHHDEAAGDASAGLCAALRATVAGADPLAAARSVARDPRLLRALDDVGDEPAIAARAAGRERGVAWTALAVALHAVTQYESYAAAVGFAIGLGRDTDTNGAVAGALAGARYGVDAIPLPWLHALRERDRIEKAARAAAQRGLETT